MNIFKYTDIDENYRKPKYVQIVDSVRRNIIVTLSNTYKPKIILVHVKKNHYLEN